EKGDWTLVLGVQSPFSHLVLSGVVDDFPLSIAVGPPTISNLIEKATKDSGCLLAEPRNDLAGARWGSGVPGKRAATRVVPWPSMPNARMVGSPGRCPMNFGDAS